MQKVTINYDLEYKGRFSTDISDFEGLTDSEIEQRIEDIVAEDVAANVCAHVENLWKLTTEITEGLKLLAVQRAEEEL